MVYRYAFSAGATLALLLILSGCTGSPADLGITGPGAPPPPPSQDDNGIDMPGVDPGSGYGPNGLPNTSGGRYFNYN
jgi:hypothetical protein